MPAPDAPRLAGVELGGTNANLVLGQGTTIIERIRLPVGAAQDTLRAIHRQLAEWQAEALGIASFGPICVDPGSPDYGILLATPKPGWSGAPILRELATAVAGPVAIHTDVVAAAMAEGTFGAARGCSDFTYITIGTGIGFGIIAAGQPITGRLHPEGGHLLVRRVAGDTFAGTCPFHGDCLEGLASGPALAARFGAPPASVADDDERWAPVVDALAEACASAMLLLASQRIIFGGGVTAARPWIPGRVAALAELKLARYLPPAPDGTFVTAALGTDAGPVGALLLAQRALNESCQPI